LVLVGGTLVVPLLRTQKQMVVPLLRTQKQMVVPLLRTQKQAQIFFLFFFFRMYR
jgi:hypothetical protein